MTQKIAIFAYKLCTESVEVINLLVKMASENNIIIYIEENTLSGLEKNTIFKKNYTTFSHTHTLPKDVDLFFAFGGDGTMLRAQRFIGKNKIPMVGINTGRLGFLAYFNIQDCTPQQITQLFKGEYLIEKRALLEVTAYDQYKTPIQLTQNNALNEVTISKKDTSSMIKIDVKLNNEPLNSYWADGLIVATPTGSTGYSLSCGGPIIDLRTHNFVITPIAPHNLFIRPFIISDNDDLELTIDSREEEFLLTLDAQVNSLSKSSIIQIKRAPYKAQIVKLSHHSYINALKDKLFWGIDQRNN